jgi:hypothetical protein
MEASQGTLKRRFAYLLSLLERAGSTFVRFPLSIISAIVAAAVAQLLVEFDAGPDAAADALWPIVMVAILGIPLFYCLRVLGESRGWPRRILLAMQMAGLAALVAYYMAMPAPVKGADVVTFLLLLSGVLLAATFLPFLGRPGEQNGFWQYNKMMFLRLAGAALYSMVLYIGLSLALVACETLLGFDFHEEIYLELWYWLIIVYSAWFFLAGIPEDVRSLQEAEDYPTGLRVFAQYVLIPLVGLSGDRRLDPRDAGTAARASHPRQSREQVDRALREVFLLGALPADHLGRGGDLDPDRRVRSHGEPLPGRCSHGLAVRHRHLLYLGAQEGHQGHPDHFVHRVGPVRLRSLGRNELRTTQPTRPSA